VLLVEDEEIVRKMIASMLRGLGYSVVVAATPREALSILESHKGDLDLLISDVMMPDMSGTELQAKVAAMDPRVKALFISGYAPHDILGKEVLERGAHFLQKPFRRDDLARAVREILDA
jgi:CheY-like chemotaxis protein